MEWLTAALTTVWTVFESIFDNLTGNAYFAVLMAIGLIIPVFRVIRRAKKTAVK